MRCKMVLRISGAVAVILALSACEGLQEQFGFTKQSPDEFRVVSQAPLSLPPDFTLRPPRPGAVRPQEGTVTQQARSAIFRLEQPKAAPMLDPVQNDGRTQGERALLKAAGADGIDPEIRRMVDLETDRINTENQEFIEALVFWREWRATGVVVDAAAEVRRLRENAALGKAVTEGETPTIQRRTDTLFESLF